LSIPAIRRLRGLTHKACDPTFLPAPASNRQGREDMTETNQVNALTKMDIAALRKADCVSFHQHDGKSYICATKRTQKSERDPFSRDADYYIPCNVSFTSYEEGVRTLFTPTFKAFDMIHTSRLDQCWQTTVLMLRAGDTLTLRWEHGALNTDGMASVDMCGDQLNLIVTRGEHKLWFAVSTTVCPRHSLSRMICDVRPARQFTIAA
jgi:hypothetical protein